jgi:hypothetical protein
VHAREADRYCGSETSADQGGVGQSATSRAFGADVRVATEGQSLFFVVGWTGPPDLAVRASGGQVVTRLPDPRRVLAVAPLEAYSALSRHPEVALAGPISIDPERFGAFARMVGLDTAPP